MIFPYMIQRKSGVAEMTKQEISQIKIFRERAEEFANTQKRDQRVPIAKYSSRNDGSPPIFEGNTPDVDEIFVLAGRFRLFYQEKEQTHFEKIINIVRRRAIDDWAVNYIDWIKAVYKDALKATDTSAKMGYPVSNEEIINLWMNSKFFHSDNIKREKLFDIHQEIGESASLFQLYIAIRRCAVSIQGFYSVVHALTEDHLYIYTPNHHFGQSESKKA